MSKKELILKTKRLTVSPMTDEQLNDLIERTTDEALKAAYSQMLEGGRNNSQKCLWYVAWKICLKENGTEIGNACFMGEQKDGAVEIGYGINEDYRGNGYAAEAAGKLIEWAFSNDDVYFVEAEADKDNIASQKVLEKLKFKQSGEGEEGPRFELEKPATSWMSIFMCFGVALGLSFGNLYDNTSVGMCLGICIGLAIGSALDASDRKKRKKLKEKRRDSDGSII